MSKRTSTQDVFDRIADEDDVVEPEPGATEDDCDDVGKEAAEPGVDDDQADSPPPRRRRIVMALAGAALVVGLAGSAFAGWQLKQANDTAAAGRAALEAARSYAVVLTTLDTRDINANFQQALDGATGEFKDEYSQGSAQLRQILIDNNASGKGVVVDAAVKSATTNKVEVLLFVDQSVANKLNPSPRIDRNRVRMTMELIDNRWLASKVEII